MKDGRFPAVGNNGDVQDLSSTTTEEFDLGGRVIIPAFNDPDNQVLETGFELNKVQLKQARRLEELLRTTQHGVDGEHMGLTRYETLQLHTNSTSYVRFGEDVKGLIAAGYYADFVVLSGNSLTRALDELIGSIKFWKYFSAARR